MEVLNLKAEGTSIQNLKAPLDFVIPPLAINQGGNYFPASGMNTMRVEPGMEECNRFFTQLLREYSGMMRLCICPVMFPSCRIIKAPCSFSSLCRASRRTPNASRPNANCVCPRLGTARRGSQNV